MTEPSEVLVQEFHRLLSDLRRTPEVQRLTSGQRIHNAAVASSSIRWQTASSSDDRPFLPSARLMALPEFDLVAQAIAAAVPASRPHATDRAASRIPVECESDNDDKHRFLACSTDRGYVVGLRGTEAAI
jgi:hypothetical protein